MPSPDQTWDEMDEQTRNISGHNFTTFLTMFMDGGPHTLKAIREFCEFQRASALHDAPRALDVDLKDFINGFRSDGDVSNEYIDAFFKKLLTDDIDEETLMGALSYYSYTHMIDVLNAGIELGYFVTAFNTVERANKVMAVLDLIGSHVRRRSEVKDN